MSFVPINSSPLSETDKNKKKQEMLNSDPFTVKLHTEAEWKNHEDEIIQTYLNTLRVLKATNEMLRSENKLLLQEINKYKKKIQDES